MKIKLTIIGLGQIGTSFGLALAEHTELIERVGYDHNKDTKERAAHMGAVDTTVKNLGSAANESNGVLLSLPVDQIYEVMKQIGPEMRAGAVLMDTAPIKSKIAEWAKELLPEERSYVGLTPVINPNYLHTDESGIDAAHADLFHNSLIAISTPPKSNSKAIKLAADLVRLIGAAPLFADLMEIDGLMTAAHIVPQVMGAALINATVDQPGWREARKLAGRAYAEVSGPIVHLGEPGALTSTVLLNRENTLRVLGSVIASLEAIRDDIQQENSSVLTERLERARRGRDRWWQERQEAIWLTAEQPDRETSPASSVFGDLLRFGKRPDKNDISERS